jgi:flagellar biosynthesis regulator FlbT
MDLDNEWSDIYTDIYNLGMVKGYLVGQLFDFKDQEILQNLEIIKKELVKEGLFDFLPKIRNKKAA